MDSPGWAALLAASMAWSGASAAETTLSFRVDVLPVLTKAGCNAGACHGAATGQGGFRLSLLGYDPEADYERITREQGGRRTDFAQPEQSLLLRKPSGQIDHDGGRKLREDSAGYDLVRRWISEGAPLGPRHLEMEGITVHPADILFSSPGEEAQLHVVAALSDGSRRDVTALAMYTSNDDAVAVVSRDGKVATTGRGLTAIAIRYSGQVDAVRVAVPLGETPPALEGFAVENFVDRSIRDELERLRIPASPLVDDATFLRRVHLDVTGRLPTPEVARAFLAEPPSIEKRRRVIDDLLSSAAFVDFWTMKLGDLFLLRGRDEAAAVYHRWLREQVAANTPYDELVRRLLTASGDPQRVGPAGFFNLAQDPRDLSEHIGRMFLGVQIACARCHAHPSDRWSQDDYHHFAAYLARVTRDGAVVIDGPRGEIEDPETGEPLVPSPLGKTRSVPPVKSEDFARSRREELADWVTSPTNPWFARAFVNRVWKHLLGRGLVEPADDLRPTNPPTHPALLEDLANQFVAQDFDLRQLVRTIISTRTYQLSSLTDERNRSDSRLYSHALLKPLSAPVFADAIAQVTGVEDVFPGFPTGTLAVQLPSPATPSAALDVLGRCSRTGPCEAPGGAGGGMAMALHLINGSTINDKLQGPRVQEWVSLTDDRLIEDLYLRAFTRFPEPHEREEWGRVLRGASDRTEATQDLVWTVLNSREFALNH